MKKRVRNLLLNPELLQSEFGQMVAFLLIQGDDFTVQATQKDNGDLIHRIESVCLCPDCRILRGVNKSIYMFLNLKKDHEASRREELKYNQQS